MLDIIFRILVDITYARFST